MAIEKKVNAIFKLMELFLERKTISKYDEDILNEFGCDSRFYCVGRFRNRSLAPKSAGWVIIRLSDLKSLVKTYKSIYFKHVGSTFPSDPQVQLYNAIDAVFLSWNNPRAIKYREINKISQGLSCKGNR